MDQEQFDTFARAFGSGLNRRKALGMGVAGLGSAFVLVGTDAAKRRQNKRKKNRRKRDDNRGAGSNNQGGTKNVCESAGGRACDVSQVGPRTVLSDCNLKQAGLVGVSLQSAVVERANLQGAHLLAANLQSASLGGACLAGASLRTADLRSANVARVDFTGADLCGADLRHSNVTAAQVAVADVCCGTLLSDGSSAAPCRVGTTCCGTGCVSLESDPYNCGACGHYCASGEICCEGQCADPVDAEMCAFENQQCLTPQDDLQAAIDAAQPGDVILLCKGAWHIESPLLISVDLQIVGGYDGDTSEIDAGYNCQVFGIRKNVHVTMTNVGVHGGLDEDGAGIFNQGYLTLGDCNVNVNNAFNYGGGIYNEGTLRLVRGYVQNNSAYNEDFGYGGLGLYNDEGTVIVEEASISYNQEERTFNAGYGGGIYNYYGEVNLGPNSLVTGNELHGSGGGLYNEGGINEIAASNIIVANHPDNCAGDSTFPNCNG